MTARVQNKGESRTASRFKIAANPYEQFAYLRSLKGEQRLDWLLSLNGQTFYSMCDAERDVTLSILSGVPVSKLNSLNDSQTYQVLTNLQGVSEEEQRIVMRRIRDLEQQKNRETEAKIRDFLQAPYQHIPHAPKELRNEAWNDALLALDFLKAIVSSDKYRKNGAEPERAHFFEPVADFIESFKDGTLPYKVTRQNETNEFGSLTGFTAEIPRAQQSAEHLIMLFLLHDSVEDFVDVTPEVVREYMLENGPSSLNAAERKFREDKIDFLIEGLKAITFTYCKRTPDGEIIKGLSDHKNPNGETDLNVYAQNMLPFWHAAVVKSKDRKNGLKGRHPSHILMPDFFTIEKDRAYRTDTAAVLKNFRLLEKTQKTFPDLKKYMGALNSQLEIVYRSFSFVTANHPHNRAYSTGTKAQRITASLDIVDFAEEVARTTNWSSKMSDIRDQYFSLVIESLRHPDLRHAIRYVGGQLHSVLAQGMNKPLYPAKTSNDNQRPLDRFDLESSP